MPIENPHRIAFDLDETLGAAIINQNNLLGFNIRVGCLDLLDDLLAKNYELVLWSISYRSYVDEVLAFNNGIFKTFFSRSYAWEDINSKWKDVRLIDVDFLVDDSPHHRDKASQYGLSEHYIIVPQYGSAEDVAHPHLWVRLVAEKLL